MSHWVDGLHAPFFDIEVCIEGSTLLALVCQLFDASALVSFSFNAAMEHVFGRLVRADCDGSPLSAGHCFLSWVLTVLPAVNF